MEQSTSSKVSVASIYSGTQSSPSPDSTNSPAGSTFSRAQSSRSSVSSASMMPSPSVGRDSFDLYGSTKRLEDVREEPHEREDEWHRDDEYAHLQDAGAVDYYAASGMSPPSQLEYSLGDQDTWSTTSSGKHPFKRARSTTARNSITDRVSSRLGSISRKWKTRSFVGPQLSITTNGQHSRRSSSATSAQILSPALSAISQHESYLPGSPVQNNMDEALRESAIVPLFMEDESDGMDSEQDEGQATTPLLPPTVAELSTKAQHSLQSPLQSPAMAPAACIGSARVSMDNNASYLPSPPLSTRPSMASLPRSPSALQNDIPPLTLYEEPADAWDDRLGHANFQIHPEPYLPETVDIDSYKEFRSNWNLARKQYAQHIARTIEHYGDTSKVYKFTQQKWEEIDDAWKTHDDSMSATLSKTLTSVSDEVGTPELPSSPALLEKPLTRVIVPSFGQSGKFPEIGDADIIGPLAVAPARAPELQRRALDSPPLSPKKRNLFKYLSDVLARHNSVAR